MGAGARGARGSAPASFRRAPRGDSPVVVARTAPREWIPVLKAGRLMSVIGSTCKEGGGSALVRPTRVVGGSAESTSLARALAVSSVGGTLHTPTTSLGKVRDQEPSRALDHSFRTKQSRQQSPPVSLLPDSPSCKPLIERWGSRAKEIVRTIQQTDNTARQQHQCFSTLTTAHDGADR